MTTKLLLLIKKAHENKVPFKFIDSSQRSNSLAFYSDIEIYSDQSEEEMIKEIEKKLRHKRIDPYKELFDEVQAVVSGLEQGYKL